MILNQTDLVAVPPAFSPLRPYQLEIATAVLDSVFYHKGLTFSVEIARQGGKNELSARLERILLILNLTQSVQLIKCSPTFKPQTVISMMRLKDRLNDIGLNGAWVSEMGYIIRFSEARAVFLSAETSSNVVGNTAHLLLEVDESQDVNPEKYTKEFKPMGATTNCTVVHYGTTWDDSTLLESVKQTNLELEKMDGIKRHFRYDYQEVGKYNPQYLINVEMERQRLGENHPLFLTQYRLLPLHGGGGFLNSTQRAQLQGDHSRQSHPSSPSLETYNSKLITHNSPVYVASIDLAGEAETGDDTYLQSLHPKQDSTVITIAELEFNAPSFDNPLLYNHCEGRNDIASASPFGERETERDFPSPILYATACPSSLPRIATRRQSLLDSLYSHSRASLSSIPAEAGIQSPSLQTYNLQPKTYNSPVLHIVEHYSWTGRKHPELYPQMIDLLKNVWHCRRIVVDATGIGQPVASFLRQALGSRVVPFTFTAQSKSELGFNLLAAINSGRLKMYAADNSPEYQEFWHQMEKAKSFYRPSRTLNFFLDPADGHDDFLMSLALLVQSGALYEPRVARARGSLSAFP